MKIGTWMAATALLFAVGAAANAQDVTGKLGKGVTEYDIAGNINFSKPSAESIQLRWAPFIDDNWQWGIDAAYAHVEHGGTAGNIGLVGNYYFRSASMGGATVPYLGANVSKNFGSGSNKATVWGFQGGVKHFLTPNVALFGELQWRHSSKLIFTKKSNTDLIFGLAFFR